MSATTRAIRENTAWLVTVDRKLDILLHLLGHVHATGEATMSRIEEKIVALATEVDGMTEVVVGVETTIDTLVASIEDAKDDPAQLDAVLASIRAQKTRLAEAVARGATDEVPEEPEDPPAA